MKLGRRNALGYLALGALCLLVSSRWLFENAFPDISSTLPSEAAGCFLAAGSWGLWRWVRPTGSRERPAHDRNLHLVTTLGLSLALTGPMIGQLVSGQALGTMAATFCLALVPAVVSVTLAATSPGGENDLPGSLWPGLAAVAGLLLLLPEPHLNGLRLWLGAVTMPLVTGVAGAQGSGPSQDSQGGRFTARYQGPLVLVGAGCTFGLASICSASARAPSLQAAGFDAVLMLCSLVALENLGGLRWSAQFVLVPWLALVEGMVILRPHADVRAWAGLALLAAGAIRLLVTGEPEEVRTSLLLSFNGPGQSRSGM